MDRLEYLDFEIRLKKREQGYAVSVIRSPAGEAEGEFVLPFSDLELENLLLKIGRTRRGVRRIGSPEWQAATAFGSKLFEAVFKGDVRGCFRSSQDKAALEDKGLRIKLRLLDAPELADLPWEYLHNRPLNRFLSLSTQTPIVRYIELPEPIPPLDVKPPMRILVMVSSPSDYDQLDVEQEKGNLQSALSNLEQRGMVEIEWLEEATLRALQQRLRRERYHIFHFIGHGGFDERAQDGLLLLEDQRGRGRRVSGQHLGVMLHDHRTLRLAVLNACEGARSSRTDPFAGVAMTLVQQGIPAVVAMQSEITDEAAIVFASEFYAAIADGYPVDASLAEARKAIFATGNDVEWGKPVLYMRSPDGQIFDVEPLSKKDREALAREGREEEARRQTELTAEEKKKRPKPTGVPKQIEALTRLMNIRRDTAEPPYVLVLGAGASLSSGCSSGARIIEDVVGQLSRKDVAALSWEEKITEFYDLLDNLSPTERYTILKSHVVGQSPSPGYRHLAQLIKAGYFDIIFSTNFDVFLEDALSDAGLRARDFTVLIGGRESEEEIVRVLGFSEPRVKLVKLHGDLPARIFAFTPEEIFQFSDKIEKVLKEYLSRDIIIVGHSMRDDDLNRCIRSRGGSIWYTNPAPPTASDFVGRAIKVRRGSIISGEMGKFDDFFQALGEALLEVPSRAAHEKEAQRQAELSALYSKGTEALGERDWPTAIEQFKALLALDDSHQDATAMLTEAQRQLEQEKEEERQRLEAQRRERERQEQLSNLYSE
ncbi:MAG: CHAT domain-containing protein, partial [Anaerolineales bacterium]|nr:CHAT domain-containing protein [Anaerolineales bacterium]